MITVILYVFLQAAYTYAGADPGFSKGGAKLTQWRRMRRLSSRTCMYGSTLLHKFFIMPPIFPSEKQKKKKKRSQPTATHTMAIT